MGTESGVVAELAPVADLSGLGWHELMAHAKALDVPLTGADRHLRKRVELEAVVAGRQRELWPVASDYAAPPVGTGGAAPRLVLPTDDMPVRMEAVEAVEAVEAEPDPLEDVAADEFESAADIVESPEIEEPEAEDPAIRCIGCGSVIPFGASYLNTPEGAVCVKCNAEQLRVREQLERQDELAEVRELAESEPSISLAHELRREEQHDIGEEPPGNGPWVLRSKFAADNLILHPGRPGRLLDDGTDIPPIPVLSIQFTNYEATIKSRKVMKRVMMLGAWSRGEIRFKSEISAAGFAARKADLVIDEARIKGQPLPDREKLIDQFYADITGQEPDRTSHGGKPGQPGTPALRRGPISTRPSGDRTVTIRGVQGDGITFIK